MDHVIVRAALAFLGGAAVSGLNAFISARLLKKRPNAFASFSPLRQVLSVGYLVIVFFGSRALGWDITAPLIGAALGLTGVSMLSAVLLARYNDTITKSAQADKKGDDPNG